MNMMRFTTMKTKLRKYPSIFLILLLAISSCFLTGCVNQHPKDSKKSSQGESVETMLEITDPKEKQAVLNAKAKVKALSGNPRIVATSPAVADICDKLDLDLVGVPKSSVSKIPSRYKKVKKVGLAMSPDMEIVSSLNPDWILAPSSLETDLKPKFEELKNTEYAFLNLRSVQGMYRSVQELGEIFGKQQEAEKMTKEFTTFYKSYTKRNKNKKHPKALVLMGLPGSYVIATENSYVGSLVKLAGGENVYQNTDQEFLTVNTEDMKKKEPDIIVRAALAVKRSSRLNRMKDTYHFGASEEMVSYAASCARDMNMEPYYLYRQKNIPGNLENVGFSKKGKECLYNILIMEELHDIIAVGAGTSSKIVHQEDHQVDRIENLKDIKQYITRIDEIIHRKELKMI